MVALPEQYLSVDDYLQLGAKSPIKRFSTLIVEVLSKSTEAFDRGDKFAAYQAI